MNLTTYLIGDFSKTQIFAEVPQADGKSMFRKLDPTGFSDKKEVIARNAQGEQRRFIFCSLSRGLKPNDLQQPDVATFQPAETAGKRLILKASENFSFEDARL
jgi:hypothetical protein